MKTLPKILANIYQNPVVWLLTIFFLLGLPFFIFFLDLDFIAKGEENLLYLIGKESPGTIFFFRYWWLRIPCILIKFIGLSLEIPCLILFSIIFLKNKTIARIVSVFLHFIFLIVLLTISIYHDFFNDLPSLEILFNRWLETKLILPQVFSQLIGFKEIFFVLLIITSALIIHFSIPKITFKKSSILIFIIPIFSGIFLFHTYNFFTQRTYEYFLVESTHGVVRHEGLLVGYTYSYFSQHKSYPKVNFPANVNTPNTSSINFSNQDQPLNIIIIQVETLEAGVIDLKIKDKEITPFLNSLKENSFYFPNFFSQIGGSGSSDSEVAALLGLLPLRGKTTWAVYSGKLGTPLNKILKKDNYYSAFMHSNQGNFFSRKKGYTNLKFDSFYSAKDYQEKAKGWHALDKEFFQQSIEKIKQLPQPFFAYLITIQIHPPVIYSKETARKFDFTNSPYSKIQKDYLKVVSEADEAIEYFFQQLQSSQKLKDSIIIIYSDPPAKVIRKTHFPPKIPLFIYVPNIKGKTINCIGTHLDIAPTITHILNIQAKNLWLGNSLFSDCKNKKIIFNNLTSITDKDGELLKKNKDTSVLPFLNYSNYILTNK